MAKGKNIINKDIIEIIITNNIPIDNNSSIIKFSFFSIIFSLY